jgi:hypothetical protein
MNGLAQFIQSRAAIFAELALLPGMGPPPRQRWALYRATLAPPLFACSFIAAISLLVSWKSDAADQLHRTVLASPVAAITPFAYTRTIGHCVRRRSESADSNLDTGTQARPTPSSVSGRRAVISA